MRSLSLWAPTQSCPPPQRRPTPTHLAGAGTPQVDAGPQAHAQQVSRRPVHQVEVEVILQLWGIQDLEGDLGDLAGRFPRRAQEFVTVDTGGCVMQADCLGGTAGSQTTLKHRLIENEKQGPALSSCQCLVLS